MKTKDEKYCNKELYSIFIRYISLFVLAFFISFLDRLFLMPTLFIVRFLLLPLPSELYARSIIVLSVPIEIIRACVAPSAFYFLLALNLTTFGISIKRRLLCLLLSWFLFLLANSIRIYGLIMVLLLNFNYFDIIHYIIWHFFSAVLVFFIWVFTINTLHIKNYPVVSDFIYIKNCLKKSR